MRFFYPHKRDPLTAALVIIALFITLFIGFELVKGLHRYHGMYAATAIEKFMPAGFLSAALSSKDLELTGWAPPDTTLQIMDHDKLLSTAVSDTQGKWSTSFAYEKRGHNLQILNANYLEKDKTNKDVGRLGLFMSGKAPESAYVWWSSEAASQLLIAPAPVDEGDLFLALAWLRDNQDIAFAGHATTGNLVQIYADDEYVGAAPVNIDGNWMLTSILKADRKTSALRLDEIQGQDVVERRVYKLNWTEGRDGWILEWPTKDAKKEIISVLKPEAGENASIDELKAGQVIPAAPAAQNKAVFH